MIGLRIAYKSLTFYSLLLLFVSCKEKKSRTLFTNLSSQETGIDFTNRLSETDDFNIIEYLYFYNGAGVSIGDINNDQLPDIFLTSNQEKNALYLNKGNFHFENITEKAGITDKGNWKTGTTMADVDGNGFLDIFVCGVGGYKKFNSANQLYLNNGNGTFKDMTNEAGLDFSGFSTQAAFFDYDNDGDLDMYLLNHSVHSVRSYGDVSLRNQHDSLAGDRLYRNELVPVGTLTFTDVTSEAGIFSSQIGYGLGIGIGDLNGDGYPDIYIANDFHENDYIYINKRNGKFKQVLEQSVAHASKFSMGLDIADINNDGRSDVMTMDMLPREERIIKSSAGDDPYEIFRFKLKHGYHPQLARNALQVNRGNDESRNPLFSDYACIAGVEASDWSWAPLIADFDNDGLKDIYVTNGIVRRPNDLDYINYISSEAAQNSLDKDLQKRMPDGKISNIFFKQTDSLRFSDKTRDFFGLQPSTSNGSAYGDLDNDGDLDLVVNNIDDGPSVYRNETNTETHRFIKISLRGQGFNTLGIGSKVSVYANGRVTRVEQFLTRGWQSSVDPMITIGTGALTKVDSVVVLWPSGKRETRTVVSTNQQIAFKESDAKHYGVIAELPSRFDRIASPDYRHHEDNFSAFSSERLIPVMSSTQGPHIARADVNGDKLTDLFVNGGAGAPGQLFIQDKDGSFRRDVQLPFLSDSASEDVASEFFDADGDGDEDLIVVSGGQISDIKLLQPKLYLNDASGRFTLAANHIPEVEINASCVRSADFDGDGSLDLFIAAKVSPGKYGRSPKSLLLKNNGNGSFADVTEKYLPDSGRLGMVSDARWSHMNQDQGPDLIVVGEWMPISVFIQQANGTFVNETTSYGLDYTNGWWNVIYPCDIDNDHDTDFLVGNVGTNGRLRASRKHPVTLVISDIDNNGSDDPIMNYYNDGVQYPFITREQLLKQVPSLKKRFVRNEDFKDVSLIEIIPPQKLKEAETRNAFQFASVSLVRKEKSFEVRELPFEVQTFPVFAFEEISTPGNSFREFVAVGNLNAVQPDIGQFDAGYGSVLRMDANGAIKSVANSGFRVKGEGRDIKQVLTAKNERLLWVTVNNDSITVFKIK